MLEHTKKRPTKRSHPTHVLFCLSEQGQIFEVPQSLVRQLKKYQVVDAAELKQAKTVLKGALAKKVNDQLAKVFESVNKKYTKPGALLKGLRYRENLSQKVFAKQIGVEQGDLSKMENGKRSIGKELAKRIAKQFGMDYRMFL